MTETVSPQNKHILNSVYFFLVFFCVRQSEFVSFNPKQIEWNKWGRQSKAIDPLNAVKQESSPKKKLYCFHLKWKVSRKDTRIISRDGEWKRSIKSQWNLFKFAFLFLSSFYFFFNRTKEIFLTLFDLKRQCATISNIVSLILSRMLFQRWIEKHRIGLISQKPTFLKNERRRNWKNFYRIFIASVKR